MNVIVVSGAGSGEATLSAFDAAPAQAGIHNLDLLQVSSILPIGWGVEVSRWYEPSPDQYGQRRLLVLAEIRTDRMGTTVGAGLNGDISV